ncbi:hypothetical protein SDC9_199512 [bioreactor metagenome]|uniref:Uncharacterized protein n=1 Tax=bioreactor metagenome TaxID=1076179 RepID=A0A645ILZ5_9ZZZZ
MGFFPEQFKIGFAFRQVHLVRDDENCAFAQPLHVKFQLFLESLEVVDGIASVNSGHIEDVYEYLSSFYVSEESVSEADIPVRSVEESGDVCHVEMPERSVIHDAYHRVKRGERVGGYLRVRI